MRNWLRCIGMVLVLKISTNRLVWLHKISLVGWLEEWLVAEKKPGWLVG